MRNAKVRLSLKEQALAFFEQKIPLNEWDFLLATFLKI
jgi:hypothetical protein